MRVPFSRYRNLSGNAGQDLRSFTFSTFFQTLFSCERKFVEFHRMASTVPAGIEINGRRYRAVKEGLASILAPYREGKQDGSEVVSTSGKPFNNNEGGQAVFYNPIQQYNRDLSVLAILTYGEGAVLEKRSRHQHKARNKDKRKKKLRERSLYQQADQHHQNVPRKRKHEEAGLDVERRTKDKSAEHDADEDLPTAQLITEDADEASKHVVNIQDEARAHDVPKVTCQSEQSTPFSILDALSASGLRAIRYAKEIPFVTNVIANDVSQEAVKSIELNIDHNELHGKVHSNVGDARAYMYSKVGNEIQTSAAGYVHRFDVVDLDPYGTAAPFLDAAVQSLLDGGLLCVTCTDAGVFASNGYPEKAYALYSGVPLKGSFSHEAGLRLLLHAVATSAAKYGIAIEPLLSLSIDFYARLFIRVHKSQQEVKTLAGTSMMVYNCDQGCGAWYSQLVARNQEKKDKIGDTFFKHSFAQAPSAEKLCEHCGTKMHLGGPIWAGPLHNPYFVQRMLDKLDTLETSTYKTTDRIKGMLTLALEEDLTLATSTAEHSEQANMTNGSNGTSSSIHEEVSPDPRIIPRLPSALIDRTPFFFIPNYLAKVLHVTTPPENLLRGAIRRLGYRVTRSHCKAGSFKTDAPFNVLWEIMREWLRQKEPDKIAKLLGEGEYEGKAKLSQGTAGWRILGKLRDTPRKRGNQIADELKAKLSMASSNSRGGFDGQVDDLKSILQAALYELEHPKSQSQQEQAGIPSDDQSNSNDSVPSQLLQDGIANDRESDVSKLNIVFDEELGKEKPRGKLVRYQINPRANWGPMNRASGF